MPPNVLVVVLDDMGLDQVSAYGDPAAPATPEIDALAAAGVTFRHAWASPVCSPSRASILTGRHGNRTGVGLRVDPDDPFELPDAELTVAEALRAAPVPYTTLAVGKWHLAGGPGGSGYDAPGRQGFDRFTGSISNLDLHSARVEGATDYSRWERCDLDEGCAISGDYATSAHVDRALDLVGGASEPWLLYAAFNAAHDPFHAPPAALNPDGVTPRDPPRARYDAMVRSADAELGRLLRGLGPDVLARTMVFVVGDNGTPGAVADPSKDPLRGKQTLYEGGVRVPFVVSGPLVDAPGTTSDALVHLVDLLPTIAEVGGLDPNALEAELGAAGPIDGASLGPLLADPAAPGREWLFTSFLRTNGPPPWPDAGFAVRDRRYKLVSSSSGEELYDLAGGTDDGPDLLAGALDPAASAALEELRRRLSEALAWPYDHG